MALSSILEKIQQKGVIKNPPVVQRATQATTLAASMNHSPSGGNRVVDPVVARLKAARKAEREKLELIKREKKGMPPKKKSTDQTHKSVSQTGQRARSTHNNRKEPKKAPLRANGAKLPPPPNALSNLEKHPKMTFAQLMQKASSIDQNKLSIEIKGNKSQEDTTKKAVTNKPNSKDSNTRRSPSTNNTLRKPPSNGSRPDVVLNRPQNLLKKESHNRLSNGDHNYPSDPRSTGPSQPHRGPLPIRKPSSQLQERLKNSGRLVEGSKNHDVRKYSKFNRNSDEYGHDGVDEDEDDDLDSFIASDEELEEDAPDYDRDEIWSMFNRGRKRTYYNHADSDSDDMEATGAEILAEEARSKRNALEEDRREQEEEERLAALKRARKAQKGQ